MGFAAIDLLLRMNRSIQAEGTFGILNMTVGTSE